MVCRRNSPSIVVRVFYFRTDTDKGDRLWKPKEELLRGEKGVKIFS
jgi:hypothetical protein